MPPRSPVAIGQRFDRLMVISEAEPLMPKPRHFTYRVNVRCDCGTIFAVREKSLKDGNTTSCGCRVVEYRASGQANLRHGLCYSRTYNVWRHIRQRCSNPNTVGWHNYGGRGIKVCARWQVFANFLADMGECPDHMTIERIRNNSGYQPGNCRWASPAEQARNTRQNKFVVVRGKRFCLADAETVLGLHRGTIRERAVRKNISLQASTDHFVAKQSVTAAPAVEGEFRRPALISRLTRR